MQLQLRGAEVNTRKEREKRGGVRQQLARARGEGEERSHDSESVLRFELPTEYIARGDVGPNRVRAGPSQNGSFTKMVANFTETQVHPEK